ncbi:MAG: DUF4386 family protein [Rhodospirillaceae bacterium]|nr:DUF4386 family protein [Rhodospirillaceae bacterium]
MSDSRPIAGAGAVILAIAFNVPYAILAATYDYPDILRKPAGEALAAFYSGGAGLIWTWYGFGIAALALVPLSIALSISTERLASRPAMAIGAAVLGSLAGLTQAIGLFRWVFVVPSIAEAYAGSADPSELREAADRAFSILNAYGGVAIGEHLGQLLTAGFVALVAALQIGERKPIIGATGMLTAFAITIGTGEGLALAVGTSGEPFSFFTIAGFGGLTIWLIATGVALMRQPLQQ